MTYLKKSYFNCVDEVSLRIHVALGAAGQSPPSAEVHPDLDVGHMDAIDCLLDRFKAEELLFAPSPVPAKRYMFDLLELCWCLVLQSDPFSDFESAPELWILFWLANDVIVELNCCFVHEQNH